MGKVFFGLEEDHTEQKPCGLVASQLVGPSCRFHLELLFKAFVSQFG